jgi:hypothetical protein
MDAKELISRVRNLQEFEVQVTLPEDFRFSGKVPYDMDIVGNQAFVKVVAETIEEATASATAYFNS